MLSLLCAVLCSCLLWLIMKPVWLGTCSQQAKAKCKQVMSLLICTFLTTKSMSCALSVLLCMMFRKSYVLSMCSAAKRVSSETAKPQKVFIFLFFLFALMNERVKRLTFSIVKVCCGGALLFLVCCSWTLIHFISNDKTNKQTKVKIT